MDRPQEQDMTYLVVYQAADGTAGYEPCADLDSAVVAAERLRNVDNVDQPRIFRTEEITISFRPYYRVEVDGEDGPVVVEAPVAAGAVEAPSEMTMPEPIVDVPEPETPWPSIDTTETGLPEIDPATDLEMDGDAIDEPVEELAPEPVLMDPPPPSVDEADATVGAPSEVDAIPLHDGFVPDPDVDSAVSPDSTFGGPVDPVIADVIPEPDLSIASMSEAAGGGFPTVDASNTAAAESVAMGDDIVGRVQGLVAEEVDDFEPPTDFPAVTPIGDTAVSDIADLDEAIVPPRRGLFGR